MSNTPADFTALFLGDLVGLSGYRAALSFLETGLGPFAPDLVIVNGENAGDDGLGLRPDQFAALRQAGADVVTTGNHVWEGRDLWPTLDAEDRLLRPDNYPRRLPGKGWTLVEKAGWKALVVNLQGRTRMASIDDPFTRAEELLAGPGEGVPLRFFDFHAEAPDEKEAFGYWLDGRATAVVGTHTHVATADERLLPRGTAYQSDLGMCGPEGSVIGSEAQVSIDRALTQLPLRPVMSAAASRVRGAVVKADRATGRALGIQRFEV